MLNVIPLKLTQLLEDNKNLKPSWVFQFIVTFNKKLKSLLTA